MIAGVGIDLVEVDRFSKLLESNRPFILKVFSEAERAYCDSRPNKAQHYAARFAAKEAFLKAAGIGLTASYELSEIEVIHTTFDRPEIRLSGLFLKIFEERGWSSIQVSLSHINEVAAAVVVIQQ